MKKTLHLNLLFLFLVVFHIAKAQKIVIFNAANDHVSKANSTMLTLEKEGVKITISPKGVMSDNKAYRIYQHSSFKVESSVGNITKLELTCVAKGTQNYGPGGFANNEGYSFEKDGKKGTWTGASPIITLSNATKQLRVAELVVTLDGEISEISSPKIEGTTNFAESTTIQLIGAEGSTIYYTLDGSIPTTQSLSGISPLSIKLENSAMVKAIAAIDGKTSEIASKAFTKSEYTTLSFNDVLALTSDKLFVNVTFNNAIVVYSDNGTLHIRQGNKALILYKTKLNIPLNSTLNGSIKFDFVRYHGVPELKDNANTTLDALSIEHSSDVTLNPLVTTLTEVNAQIGICDLVKLINVQIIKEEVNAKETYYASANGEKVILFKNENLFKNLANNGKSYTLIGLFNSLFKNKSEIKPIEINETSTGIHNFPTLDRSQKSSIYNLYGVKVNTNYKGVIIINGKKYINK